MFCHLVTRKVKHSLYKGLSDIQSDPLDILSLKHWVVDKLHWTNFFVVKEIVKEEIYRGPHYTWKRYWYIIQTTRNLFCTKKKDDSIKSRHYRWKINKITY